VLLFVSLLALRLPGDPVLAQNAKTLAGKVLFPDGTPVADARVTATTDCQTYHAGYRLVRFATTSLDGTFSMAAFGEDCQRYRFTADKRDDFWLRTGDDVFYGGSNGTSPVLDLSLASASQPVTILLGARGGKVDIQVWDNATKRFIYALVSIEHKPVEGKKFGSEDIATGKDGSADTLFLPAGDYTASVEQFQCRDKIFWAITPPVFTFTAVGGERSVLKVSIDVRSIKSTPHGVKCVP
jgi:hypothetical protein